MEGVFKCPQRTPTWHHTCDRSTNSFFQFFIGVHMCQYSVWCLCVYQCFICKQCSTNTSDERCVQCPTTNIGHRHTTHVTVQSIHFLKFWLVPILCLVSASYTNYVAPTLLMEGVSGCLKPETNTTPHMWPLH